MKYLGINLTKGLQDLYTENYKPCSDKIRKAKEMQRYIMLNIVNVPISLNNL